VQVQPSAPPGVQVQPSAPPGVQVQRTRIVDAAGRGEFVTIAAAIASAQPGERLLVRPGVYQETLVVDKPLDIVGDGAAAEIVVVAAERFAVRFSAARALLSNVTVRSSGSEAAVQIGGSIRIEGCDISSGEWSPCVKVRGESLAHLARCKIHGGYDGIVVAGAKAVLEDNDIFRNKYAGVRLLESTDLRGNTIHDNGSFGIHAGGGHATVAHNQIHDNASHGVSISAPTVAILTDNKITRNGGSAIRLSGVGGTFEANDLRGNREGPWSLRDALAVHGRNLE
jgi:F-box protein 11